jgi:hypothetical protein
MSQAIIRAGFETALKAWADAQTPAIPVAWQNVTFNPPTGRYVEAQLIPAPAKKLTLDGIGRTYRGIFQVTFRMPIGTGAGTVESLAASLDAAFADSFTHDGLRIYLLSPISLAPPLPAPDRYVVPASAEYRADTV